jgi:V8-like Glu-specific endopeptidase
MMRRFAAAMAVLGFVVGAGVASAGAQTQPGRGAGQSVDARAEHQRIVDFWTPARRAAAVPADLARPTPARGKPGGGGGGGTGTVTGATWTQGGSVAVTTGRVFFQSGNFLYSCSGSAVQSTSGSLVLTAGHCVHSGGSSGSFYTTNWIFYPHYNNGPDSALGGWTATDLFTTTAWGTTTNDFADDIGIAAVIGDGTASLTQVLQGAGATVPSIAFSPAVAPVDGDQYTTFGYPAEQKYTGATLVFCQGPVKVGLDQESSVALACDMNGGSSGGPMFRGAPTPNGVGMVINSVNSYTYRSLKGYMFGPVFDTGESNAYSGADTPTGDCTGNTSTYLCADISDPAP